MKNLLTEMLELFGLKIEQRDKSVPPGVTGVGSHADIASVFHADAARQRSDSMFFSLGARRRIVIEDNSAMLR
jgi:hypothetical protein